MALSHVTKVYAVTAARIAKMLTDPAGGSSTYGATMAVPGAKKLTLSGDVNAKELRGDNTLLDSDAVLASIRGHLDHAKLSLDVLAVLIGGITVDTGTTPNQVSTFTVLGNSGAATPSVPQYFKIEARSLDADTITGDVHYVLLKNKITGYPDMGLNEEDYQPFGFDFTALPRISDGQWKQIVLNETAVAVA